MPYYAPLTDIIATPATGVVVPSAWGDQVDDNLVHFYEGTWFRAIGGATSLPDSTLTTVAMTSIVISDTATDEATISIVSGAVQVTKPGLWLVCACAHLGAGANVQILAAIVTTDGGQVTQTISDSATNRAAFATSTVTNVTSNPASISLACYQTTGTFLPVTVNNYSPRLVGVWLGLAP